MNKTIGFQIDLLQKRRNESNTKKFTNSSIKKLKKIGFLYGIVITLVGVSICSYTSVHTFQRIKYKDKLTTKAIEYNDLKSRYESMNKSIKKIYSINNNIAQGILGTKSGSALLLELKTIMPKTIQLSSMQSKGKRLILEGKALQPNALESINAFKLKVSNSFLIDNNTSKLSEIRTSIYRDKKYLNFTLTSDFSKLNYNKIKSNYLKHGSMGLLERAKNLKKEGLIK
tara:strand:+ start:52 stop:735 length:684 start_codon:yes stop_codon:yes gene_type:complete